MKNQIFHPHPDLLPSREKGQNAWNCFHVDTSKNALEKAKKK
jgi:hypothetical protein